MLKKAKAQARSESTESEKNGSPGAKPRDIAETILKSSHSIWLAGLGAFAKAQQRIRKFSLVHVKGNCDSESASEVGVELDEAIDSILDTLNQQLQQLEEVGNCDPQLPPVAERQHLLKLIPDLNASGYTDGAAFLNNEVTGTCDEGDLG